MNTIQKDRNGFISIDLKVANMRNEQNGAYFHHLVFKTLPFQIDEETKTHLQGYFWNNEGKEGGGTFIKWYNEQK